MNPLLRALSAESVKLRGTLALWMCLIAPSVVVVLYVLQISFSRIPADRVADPVHAWQGFSQSILALWAFLMLPLFITLESALLAGLEHADHQFKHLLALPLPREVHYLAKLAALAAFVAAAFVVLLALMPLGAAALGVLKPQFGIAGGPPWRSLLGTAAACYAASLLMVALHTWLAIRWRSFTVAVSIGMSATVMGFLIGQSERFGHWYPWSMPLQVLAGKGQWTGFVVVAGIFGGLLVGLAGLLDFRRREFA
ncbi:hypothetical protein BH11PSE14_BH11PSE14_15540 [soil metagenome]